MPVKIFICYARGDERLLNNLKKQLSSLQHEGLIDLWYDRNISAGSEWEQEINQHLNSAEIILLLVSPDFIASQYCYGVEMKRALERHEQRDAVVIPIILRSVDWKNTPLSKLQALPADGKAVMKWRNRDDAYLDIAIGIKKVIEKISINSSSRMLLNQNNIFHQEQKYNQKAYMLSNTLKISKESHQQVGTKQKHPSPKRVIPVNTLFYGDNLEILREYIPDNSVDLIYLDPPF